MAGCVFGVVASFVCCVLLSFQRYPGVALGMTDGERCCGHKLNKEEKNESSFE